MNVWIILVWLIPVWSVPLLRCWMDIWIILGWLIIVWSVPFLECGMDIWIILIWLITIKPSTLIILISIILFWRWDTLPSKIASKILGCSIISWCNLFVFNFNKFISLLFGPVASKHSGNNRDDNSNFDNIFYLLN